MIIITWWVAILEQYCWDIYFPEVWMLPQLCTINGFCGRTWAYSISCCMQQYSLLSALSYGLLLPSLELVSTSSKTLVQQLQMGICVMLCWCTNSGVYQHNLLRRSKAWEEESGVWYRKEIRKGTMIGAILRTFLVGLSAEKKTFFLLAVLLASMLNNLPIPCSYCTL